MVTPSNNFNIKFKSEFTSPTNVSSLENSTNDIKIVKSEESPVNIIPDNNEVKKERKSLVLSKTLSLTSSATSSTTTSTSASVTTSVSISTESKEFHQHDPILRNEDGSMLTTPRNIPMVITKDQNKLIHLDPVPNFQDKADIKPWLQKIFYPMGIEIVIERSDNTKVIFKCKASKRGRKSRKSSTNVTPNKVISTFEDTVKECAEKFIVHSEVALRKQTSENVKGLSDSKNSTSISQKPVILSSQPPRVKKKRAVSRFNVCPFRIRATYSLKRRKWSIVVLNNTHSHELNFDPNSEEYKKFKAKLRENNDIEAIKKFDELEYRKRSNLPIHTAMIPCDCGLTNEIESFNIVIPNVNAVKSTSTPTTINSIPNNTDYPNTNNVHNDSNKIVTSTINGDSNKRKTIQDLIMQKNWKNSVTEKGGNDASILHTEFTTVDHINNIHISGTQPPQPLSTLPEQQQTSIINKSPDWGIQEKSNNYNNFNPLYQNLMTNNNNNNNNYEQNYKNNFGIGYNHLGTFYGLTNNDSHTEIIRAKDVIHDEENDEELGNYVQRVNDDYAYNGNNNVIANEYYHNDFDSYNTDHFYKFNGPFDSGNIIFSNDYNHFINSINNNGNTHRHNSIYNPSDDCSNLNNTNNNDNNNNNNNNNNRHSTLANIHNNSDNSMNTNVTNNNCNNTIKGNTTVNNSYNHHFNSHVHEMDDDLLLINNFIDDPVFNESHLNMMNLHSMNLETPFQDKHNNNNNNNNNNNATTNTAVTISNNNNNNTTTTTTTNNNSNNNNNNNNNNANVNLIDLNEIDFTDIFINNGYNTMNKFTQRNTTIIKNQSSKEKLEKPEEEKNVGILQQNSISDENLQKELNQFINNSNETKEPKKTQ